MADNNNGTINTVANSLSGVTGSLTSLVAWAKNIFGQYAMWIFGLVGLFFISKIFKVKL